MVAPVGRWLVAITLALSATVGAHDGPHEPGPDDELFKVSKAGEVKLKVDVVMAGVPVPKGNYLLEHRVEGARHLLLLSRRRGNDPAEVFTVPTRLFAGTESARGSWLLAERLKDGSYRLSVGQIAGESGDHVPDAGPQS